MKCLDVAVAIVLHESKLLITRRPESGVLGGYWEFPGGKVEAGESLENCVRRELLEELAIHVQPVMSFTPILHRYTDREIHLHPFLCTLESGRPEPLACSEFRWVLPLQLTQFKFPEVNQTLLVELLHALPLSHSPATVIPAPTMAAAISTSKKNQRQPASV